MTQFDFFNDEPAAAAPGAAPPELEQPRADLASGQHPRAELELTSDSGVEAQARALYEDCPTVKPGWAQIGEETRSVWREYARRRSEGDPNWRSAVAPRERQR